MPYVKKRRARRSFRKRNYRKRSAYPAPALALLKKPTLVPPIPWGTGMIAKLRYSDVVSINTTAGGISSYTFRATSAFDPDFTGTGHQPRGFDQLAALYTRYRVLMSKMTVRSNTIDSVPVTAFVSMSPDGAAPGNTSGWLEMPSRKMLMLNSQNAGKIASIGFSGVKTYGKTYLEDDDYQALVTTNPVETAYFQIAVTASDGVSDPGPVYFTVIIDYIVHFTEHLLPSQS